MNLVKHKPHSVWQLQDAKSRFSNVVKKAASGEPQLVTRNGVPMVYIVDVKSFERLTKKSISRKDVLKESPCREVKLNLDRQAGEGREVML